MRLLVRQPTQPQFRPHVQRVRHLSRFQATVLRSTRCYRVIAAVSAPSKAESRSPGRTSSRSASLEVDSVERCGKKSKDAPDEHRGIEQNPRTLGSQLNSIWAQVFHRWGSVDCDEIADEAKKTAQVVEPLAEKEKERKKATDLPNITPYLHTVEVTETKHVRLLASLATWTYRIARLQLVTTSHLCELSLVVRDCPRTLREVFSEGDGMSPCQEAVINSRTALLSVCKTAQDDTMTAIQRARPRVPHQEMSRTELVAMKLAEAMEAAGALAASTSGIIIGSSVAPLTRTVARAGSSLALATIGAITAIATAAMRKDERKRQEATAHAQECNVTTAGEACPSHWFVADDPGTHTRYFVIQGSDSIESWKTNLSFDPVVFEDPCLGVKVHRGVYTAAKALYERFLPLIQEHLASSPFAKIALTGHSLGGSLATCVALMLLYRGQVPPRVLEPVYTFGTAAVFCQGAVGKCEARSCAGCGSEAEAAAMAAARMQGCAPGGRSLPRRLGLPESGIRNVIMAMDIVPRTFACDYSLVADVLRNFSPAFASLNSLQAADKKLLYTNLGQMMVLQPGLDLAWARPDGHHPMLPPGPSLHVMRPPAQLAAHAGPAAAEDEHGVALSGSAVGAGVPATLRDAVLAIMDNPHPLEVLADRSAYGSAGSISRHHNPSHYAQALSRALRRQAQQLADTPLPPTRCVSPMPAPHPALQSLPGWKAFPPQPAGTARSIGSSA